MSIDVEERPVEMEDVSLPYDVAEVPDYRVLSGQAVASCVLGVLSAAVLLSYEYGLALGVIPLIAIVLGARALLAIRANPREMTGLGLAKAGLGLAIVFLIGGYSLASYVYATEVPDGYQRIDYARLQPDASKAGEIVPPSALELDGQQVFIKGYVYPTGQEKGIKQFVLCRDNGDCCFGGQPKLTDKIVVTLADPLRLTYSTRLQRLAGTFKVARKQPSGGMLEAVYELQADHLE